MADRLRGGGGGWGRLVGILYLEQMGLATELTSAPPCPAPTRPACRWPGLARLGPAARRGVANLLLK